MSAASKVLYARIRPQIKDRIDELSETTGVPISTIVDLLLARALGIEDADPRARVLRALDGSGS